MCVSVRLLVQGPQTTCHCWIWLERAPTGLHRPSASCCLSLSSSPVFTLSKHSFLSVIHPTAYADSERALSTTKRTHVLFPPVPHTHKCILGQATRERLCYAIHVWHLLCEAAAKITHLFTSHRWPCFFTNMQIQYCFNIIIFIRMPVSGKQQICSVQTPIAKFHCFIFFK